MSDRITCTKCGSVLTGSTITPAKASEWLTSHPCGEPTSEVAVLPTADVSDEAITEALRPVECVANPYGEGYLALGEDAEQLLPAVRALLDAQAAAHAAEIADLQVEVEALRAEGERLRGRRDMAAELREHGILWALNRHAFHPRGFALVFKVDDETGEVVDWLISGDGTEPWSFGDDDHEEFRAFETLLNLHRKTRVDRETLGDVPADPIAVMLRGETDR